MNYFFRKNHPLYLILILAFSVRILYFGFPFFSSEEARIASRGYYLSSAGKDELGRKFPLIFNSLEDYQLPTTSYITAVGIFTFGKNDFGARLPFILFGVLTVFLIYKICYLVSGDMKTALIAAFLAAISPGLVFISKFPNQLIILITFFCLIFLTLMQKKINYLHIFFLFVASFLTSKNAWMLLVPFSAFVLFVLNKNPQVNKKPILLLAAGLTVVALLLYINIPQAKRSLLENHFPLFQDITIQNGINKLRGQGWQSNWPSFISRVVYNKLDIFLVGLLQWISAVNLKFFGFYEDFYKLNFAYSGIFINVLIIPFMISVYQLIRKKNIITFFIPLLYILTFPIFFNKQSMEVYYLITPFLVILIATGFKSLPNKLTGVILVIPFLIYTFSFVVVAPYKRTEDQIRSAFLAKLLTDTLSKNSQNFLFSDDLEQDLAPMLMWYGNIELTEDGKIDYPYKYRDYTVGENKKILASESKLRGCKEGESSMSLLSERDMDKVRPLNAVINPTIYSAQIKQIKAFFVESSICLE